MPSKRLTAPTIGYLKTDKPQEDFWDTVTPGFGIRVTRGGTQTFIVMTRALERGKWVKRRIKIGRVGDPLDSEGKQVLDLAEARRRARGIIAAAGEGRNPTAQLETPPDVQRVARSADCFANVRDAFLKQYRTRQKKKPKPRTLEEMTRVLSGARFKDWEGRPITEITKQDVRDLLSTIIADGHDARANKTLVVLRQVFNWAYDHDKIESVPTDRIKPPGAESSRDRVMSASELVAIWNACYGSGRGHGGRDSHVYGDIVRVLMLTGQRRNEVAQMQWSEIDFDRRLWSLPAARSKNALPHLVPLSSPVLAILKRQQAQRVEWEEPCPWVFTSNGETPFSGWSQSKRRLDERCGVAYWRIHDLRRTLVTGMNEELRISPHVVESVVNHVSGTARRGAAGVYNRALYIDERRRALERWSRYVLQQVAKARQRPATGGKGSNSGPG